MEKLFNQKRIEFSLKQQWSTERKIEHALKMVQFFWDKISDEYAANTHVSVGGLDSIMLYLLIKKYINPDIVGISVSTLEDKSIQEQHKKLGLILLTPEKSKFEVLHEFGFPVISKEKALKIETVNNPTEKNKTLRNAIMTGDCGEQGHFAKNSRMKLPLKWQKLFCGKENPEYKIPNFKVSAQCCEWLKERPCDNWAKANNSYAYLGLMASEGGRREKSLIMNGCNYFGKSRKAVRSCPFAIFTQHDILTLAIQEGWTEYIPAIYGDIVSEKGVLKTTGASRTGCELCGFGIHIEKRPHRFDRLREINPKAWDYYMYRCVTDESGTYGWGRVLDYIGVKWKTPAPAKTVQQEFEIIDNIHNNHELLEVE